MALVDEERRIVDVVTGVERSDPLVNTQRIVGLDDDYDACRAGWDMPPG